MPRRILSREELLAEFKRREQEQKAMQQCIRSSKERICKNCKRSWYREIPPTGSFTDVAEYCGCRLKASLVDPSGSCENFA